MTKVRCCVEVIPNNLSRGIKRVAAALKRYAPEWVQLVESPSDADVWLVHVIGNDGMEVADTFAGDVAYVQYCLLTAGGDPETWINRWNKARAVWSYYDLNAYATEHYPHKGGWWSFKFYHAPLGVDGDVFKPQFPTRKRFLIGTSGYVAETEGVSECHAAARALQREHFHLGPNLNLGPGVLYIQNCADEDVAEFWSQCSFVAGLRRVEGFELPVLEALACGSRPVVFDAPHYRKWFGEHAEYVREVDHDGLVAQLTEVMAQPVRIVTAAERAHVLAQFDWRRLAAGFWEALR